MSCKCNKRAKSIERIFMAKRGRPRRVGRPRKRRRTVYCRTGKKHSKQIFSFKFPM